MQDTGTIIVLLLYLALMVFLIAAGWKIFTKAGKPGWAILVPIYNLIVYLEIVKRPMWWIVLFLLPFISIVVYIIMMFDLAKVFGKSGGFAIGLILLPFIFFPILGFGSATYKG